MRPALFASVMILESRDLAMEFCTTITGPPASPAVLSRKKEDGAMAIGIYFSPPAMSAAKYDECIRLLKKAGAGNPAGRSYHAAFGPQDKLMVFDVWTSQAAFDKFGKTLTPILQQLGIDAGRCGTADRDSGA